MTALPVYKSLEGSNCALFVVFYICGAWRRGDAQQILIFLNKQMIPTIQTGMCQAALAVCGCFSIEASDLLLFQMVPCALEGWLHFPQCNKQTLPGEELKSGWLALALELFNFFVPHLGQD